MVCVNPAYRLFELEYALNKVECAAIITAEHFKNSHYLSMSLHQNYRTANQVFLKSEKLPYLTTVIRMGEVKSPGMHNFDEVFRRNFPCHGVLDAWKAQAPPN